MMIMCALCDFILIICNAALHTSIEIRYLIHYLFSFYSIFLLYIVFINYYIFQMYYMKYNDYCYIDKLPFHRPIFHFWPDVVYNRAFHS